MDNQEAIRLIRNHPTMCEFPDAYPYYQQALTAVSKLPSAQPERMEGEWIPSFNGRFTGGAYWFQCSKCERIVPDVRNGGWNFCPNCGSYMREDQDGKSN